MEDYDINVRFAEEDQNDTGILLDQYIVFRDQATGRIKEIPISAMVDMKNSTSFSAIKHKDLRRVTVYSAVLAGYNANEVVDNVKQSITGFSGFPRDVEYKSQEKSQNKRKHELPPWSFGDRFGLNRILTGVAVQLHFQPAHYFAFYFLELYGRSLRD